MGIWKELVKGRKMADAFGEAAGRRAANNTQSNVDTWSKLAAAKNPELYDIFKRAKTAGYDMQRIANDLDEMAKAGETRYFPKGTDKEYSSLKEINQENYGPGESLNKDLSRKAEATASDVANEKMRKENGNAPLNDDFDEEMLSMHREDIENDFYEALKDSIIRHGGNVEIIDMMDKVKADMLK